MHDYDGPSASAVYDRIFTPASATPYLDHYVPQAVVTWTNWNENGEDLILLGMYRPDHPSYLVGIDPDSGLVVGTVAVAAAHLGGMAFFGPWLFTGDNPWPKPGSPTVTRYRTDALADAMGASIDDQQTPFLNADGPAEDITATDFMAVEGDSLYTGNHGNGGVPGLMYRYVLAGNGSLRRVEGPWTVPDRAQGLVITRHDFIFSTDNGVDRGALQVVRRAAPNSTGPPVGCIWTPSLPEGLSLHGGRVWAAYESGSHRFDRKPVRNRISDLHTAALRDVLGAADPA
jgi:hypothetical protein